MPNGYAVSVGSCQIATTGTAGYYCQCGQWVAYGVAHLCTTPNISSSIWSYPAMNTMPKRFNGKVKTIDRLPAGAVGDSYYVEAPGVLVVRHTDGWLIVPSADAD